MGLSSFVRSHYFSIEIVNAHSEVAESKAGKRILGVVVLLYDYDVFWAVRGDDSNDNDINGDEEKLLPSTWNFGPITNCWS